MSILDFFKPKNEKDKAIAKYYKNYQERPYISTERDFKKWNEMVSQFPKMLVQKEMMIRNEDGLLPGHIYQLYWIQKYKSGRRIPEYFEYEFGIDFNKEKDLLTLNNYIEDNTVTKKGTDIIEKYNYVITEKTEKSKAPRFNITKELAKYRKERKKQLEQGIKPSETEDEYKGFLYQMNGIADYKDKDFINAKINLIKAHSLGFYSPGGINYLAKIYRKEKNYSEEINSIETGLKNLDYKENLSESTLSDLKKRLEKAKMLLSKTEKKL